jgi:nucleotide-binding universal stress UspA family protein
VNELPHSFSRILLPVDGSFQSKVAIDMTLLISKIFDSKVTVMHVVPNEVLSLANRIYVPRENFAPISTATGQFPRTIIVPPTKEYLIPDEVVNEVIAGYEENGENLLSEAVSLFAKEGIVAVQKLEKQNSATDAILEEVERGNYDCVIMGNSGNEEDESDLHLGSVAAKVSNSNLTDILVTRKKADLQSIILAVDGTEKDVKAIEQTNILAKAAKSRVILINVQEKLLSKFGQTAKDIGLEILKRTVVMLPDIEVVQKLMSGDPANSIVEEAKQDDADLVILRRGGNGRFANLLGSVSDHVLRHATVSVLIIK